MYMTEGDTPSTPSNPDSGSVPAVPTEPKAPDRENPFWRGKFWIGDDDGEIPDLPPRKDRDQPEK